jgi:hypothetical protein
MWPASRRSENNGLERWFRNASGLALPRGRLASRAVEFHQAQADGMLPEADSRSQIFRDAPQWAAACARRAGIDFRHLR